MYNMCQSFNFFDVIEEYYASKTAEEELACILLNFLFVLVGRKDFFCMCQWTIDMVKNNWK